MSCKSLCFLIRQYKGNAPHCHTAGYSQHVRPITRGKPCLPSPPTPPGDGSPGASSSHHQGYCRPSFLVLGARITAHCCMHSHLEQGSGSSHKEQVFCFVFLLFFIYWSCQNDPLPRPTVLYALALQTLVPYVCVQPGDSLTSPSYSFFHAVPLYFLKI